jgi:hypothetical protein
MKLGLPGVVFLTLFAAGPALAASPATPPAQSVTPAVWFPYDMIVDLKNLPRVYSCDDLYYKFRDVLDLLGAQHWPTIHTYRCDSRSPQVHLQFALAKPAAGPALPYATMQASDATIDLAPGKPPSLLDSDCQLLQQMKDTLLPSLPVKVLSYRMTCAAPSHSQKRYRLQVQALLPLSAKRMADVHPGALPASASPGHPGRAE